MAISDEPAPIDDPVMRNDWFVVARSEDIAEGGMMPARLLGTDLVLWRTGGEVMAWRDLCVHRGSRLSLGKIEDGQLVCPYHAWHYDRTGACTLIPAMPGVKPPRRARADTFLAKERYGFVWASLGAPANDLPPFPEWRKNAFRKVIAGPYNFHANPFRTVENFIDIPHFPFVHPMINGDPDRPDPVGDYDVFRDEDGIRMSPVEVFQPFGDHRGVPVTAVYRYSCFRPLTAYFSKDTGQGNLFCMMLTVTPLKEDDCLVWLLVAINFGEELSDAQIVARQDQVFAQDKWIVESQRPQRIPLDLQDELHVRVDKFSVAYRRWLKEKGLRWGAAQ